MQINSFPHASLFISRSESIRLSAANKRAKDLLCTSPGSSACNQCHSCQLFEKKAHADFYCLESINDVITIDQVRDLIQKSALAPIESHCKVFMIPEVQNMRLESANALLKTLEDPPAYVYFILSAPYAEMLLSTIRSRCSITRISRPKEIQIQESMLPVLDALDRVLAGDYIAIFSNGKLWDLFKEDKNSLYGLFREYLNEFIRYLSQNYSGKWCDRFSRLPFMSIQTLKKAIVEMDLLYAQSNINLNFQLSIESWLLNIWELEYGQGCRNTI